MLSWRDIAIGGVIAFLPPVVYLALAELIRMGAIAEPTGLGRDLLSALQLNAIVGVILAFLGIWMVGRGVRLTSPWAWVALFIIAAPIIAFVWFVSYATFGGATGSPF